MAQSLLALVLIVTVLIAVWAYNSAKVAYSVQRLYNSVNRLKFYTYLANVEKVQIGERKTIDGTTVKTYRFRDSSEVELRYTQKNQIIEVTVRKTCNTKKDRARKLFSKFAKTQKYD